MADFFILLPYGGSLFDFFVGGSLFPRFHLFICPFLISTAILNRSYSLSSNAAMSGGRPAHLPAKVTSAGQVAIRTNVFDGLDEAFAYIASCPEQQRYSIELELQGFVMAALEINKEYIV